MVDFNEKLQQEKAKIVSDKEFILLPLNTEQNLRHAIRILLAQVEELTTRIEEVEKKVI